MFSEPPASNECNAADERLSLLDSSALRETNAIVARDDFIAGSALISLLDSSALRESNAIVARDDFIA